ncbi:unnamed protein product [Coccothraustes coccothraustes]
MLSLCRTGGPGGCRLLPGSAQTCGRHAPPPPRIYLSPRDYVLPEYPHPYDYVKPTYPSPARLPPPNVVAAFQPHLEDSPSPFVPLSAPPALQAAPGVSPPQPA